MVKRTLCAILSLVMLLCAFPLTAFAEEFVVSEAQKLGTSLDLTSMNMSGNWNTLWESESNNSRSKADYISEDFTLVSGRVGGSDSYDYFKVTLSRKYKLTFAGISYFNTDVTRFKLCDKSGTVLKTATYEGRTANSDSSTGYITEYSLTKTLSAGTYYIRVGQKSSKYIGDYDFAFVLEPVLSAPKVSTSVKTSTGKPVVKWNAVSGADYYRVYRATSKSGTYKLVKSTSGTSYTDTSATAGKKYYYKVKAMSRDGDHENSSYSSVVSRVCDCARPDVWLTYKSNGKTIVNWDSVSGAKNYKVYCSTSKSGTYKCIGTTSKTRLLHSDGKSGKVYYYKVKAISKATTSANSAYSVIQSQRVK